MQLRRQQMNNILSKASMKFLREKFKEEKKKVVFTNGVFDIIHSGHIDYLVKAKALGDILIVGLNSDSSVRRIKGEKRPIVSQTDRAFVLFNLKPVDYVFFFEEDPRLEIIKDLVLMFLLKEPTGL